MATSEQRISRDLTAEILLPPIGAGMLIFLSLLGYMSGLHRTQVLAVVAPVLLAGLVIGTWQAYRRGLVDRVRLTQQGLLANIRGQDTLLAWQRISAIEGQQGWKGERIRVRVVHPRLQGGMLEFAPVGARGSMLERLRAIWIPSRASAGAAPGTPLNVPAAAPSSAPPRPASGRMPAQ